MRGLEVPTRKRNRYQAKRPKSGLFWCWKCDRNHVRKGEKCSLCGALYGKSRRKHRNELALQ